MRNTWQVTVDLWDEFSDVDARWARTIAATLASLRPHEYIRWTLTHPRTDLAAGPVPFLLARTYNDDAIVLEVTGNPILRGAMRLTFDQERELRLLGFLEPRPSGTLLRRSGFWQIHSDFIHVGPLGIIVFAVITGVMELPHPAMAPIDGTSEFGPLGERPCLHALQCTCHTGRRK